jgi:drug/metabolite transporter (DMT)-like permease
MWASAQTLVKYSYGLPQASDVNLALCSATGAALTLGVFGIWKGRQGRHSVREWAHSFLPMGLMAGGDLGVIIASRYGPISIVTPITGAYPVVTLVFAALVLRERIMPLQWVCVTAIIIGMIFCAP